MEISFNNNNDHYNNNTDNDNSNGKELWPTEIEPFVALVHCSLSSWHQFACRRNINRSAHVIIK